VNDLISGVTAIPDIGGENPAVQFEIARLKDALTALTVSVDRLANTRTILTDEAIGQLGRAVIDTLTKMRGCASNAGRMPPYLGDNAAEKANLEQAVLNKPVL
jgi:hypothetical protein